MSDASGQEASRRSGSIEAYALLDNVRSAWNVGSILRTADGFGFRHVYLCGITPPPENPAVRKTSLGAEEYVAWSWHRNALTLAAELKARGLVLWALEHSPTSRPIGEVRKGQPNDGSRVLIVGNEVTGVDPGLLELADCIIHLPMRGHKRSFNVAIAFALAAQMIYGLAES